VCKTSLPFKLTNCSGPLQKVLLRTRNTPDKPTITISVSTGTNYFNFIGLIGKYFLRDEKNNENKMHGGITHGKTVPNTSLTNQNPACKSFVIRMLKHTKIDSNFTDWWHDDRKRLPTLNDNQNVTDKTVHTIRPAPQPNFIGRIMKAQSTNTTLFQENKHVLLHDSQPHSKHWEPGCIFSAGAPGLYAAGIFALMTGGMSGNKQTGLTAIYLSKNGLNNEFSNKFTQNTNSWKLEYFCHTKKIFLCTKAKAKKQPIRIFVQNRVCQPYFF
jgi:hypothetical protein